MMLNKINAVLLMFCTVMVFSAADNRTDDWQKGVSASKAAVTSKPVVASRSKTSTRQQIAQPQPRREQPPQVVDRKPLIQAHPTQPDYQNRPGLRVYAVPVAPAPVQRNNLFNHQHHNKWQPLYNFYNGQYNFYPYVNVGASVELSADFSTIFYNGQNFYYDRGSFYVQDAEGYLAVPPPMGIIVSAIPPNARELEMGGQMFFRKKGVFYIQVQQGYQVVQPVPWPADNS